MLGNKKTRFRSRPSIAKDPLIREQDLPPEITGAPARATVRREYHVQSERERILKALETAKGKRGEAARILGIGRATLYRRMKACMINPSGLPRSANWQSDGHKISPCLLSFLYGR